MNISVQLKLLAKKELEEVKEQALNSSQRLILQSIIVLKNSLQDLICYLRKKWDLPKPIPQTTHNQ